MSTAVEHCLPRHKRIASKFNNTSPRLRKREKSLKAALKKGENMSAEFDKFAKEYRTAHSTLLELSGETSTFFAEYKAQKLGEWLPEFFTEIPQTILDFGCGDGLMTNFVHQQFLTSTIYGVDPSAESIKLAGECYSEINFQISGENLDLFLNDQFDLIYAASVFHHIPFEQHAHYMQELNRVLKPAGILVLFELNPFNPGTRYIFNNAPMDANATMLTPHYAKKLLKPYGRTTTKFYGFFPHLLRKLRWTEQFLTKLPLGGLYASFLKKSV